MPEIDSKKQHIFFIIPGEPIGKARHRTGRGITYTPKKTKDYEFLVQQCWSLATRGVWDKEGPFKIFILAEFSIPKSKSKSWKEKAKNGEIFVTKKPDCDNIAKIVLDGLNESAFNDDAQIVELQVKKIYTEKPPCVKVYIEAGEEKEPLS